MLFYTVGQSAAFLLMLECGLQIGLVYDGFRLLRRLFRPGILMSLILDLLFGAGAAGLLIAALLRALDGELRLYALLGALAGFLLYGVTLSRLLGALGARLAKWGERAARWLGRREFIKKMLK